MRSFLIALLVLSAPFFIVSCKSEAAAKVNVCDTVCVRDSMKFSLDDHKLKPYLYISASNCNADSISWSYLDMGTVKQMGVNELAGREVKLNPAAVDCYIRDTTYAWLSFNDCATGRGYIAKIPFSAYRKGSTLTSALNPFDKKFSVAKGLAVYSDRGNLFAEEMATGKQAWMTFGQHIEIDYDNLHDYVDSVNVTPTHMWARVMVNKEWKVFEKNITLK